MKKYYIREKNGGTYWMRRTGSNSTYGEYEYGYGHTSDIEKAGEFGEKYAELIGKQERNRVDVILVYKMDEDPQFNPLPIPNRAIRI